MTSAKELRQFGLVVGGVFALIGLWPILRGGAPRLPSLVVAGLLIALALVAPGSLRRVHALWMVVGAALGWVNTRIILAVAFYAIFTPIGLVLRALGKDEMRRRVSASDTYRVPRSSRPGSHMLRQF